jgi:hypothetical protein
MFFSYRYSPSEIDAIYSNYRGSDFYSVRHSWEPWYNESVNDAFSDARESDLQIESRRSFTETVLSEAGVKINTLQGCIDFGGDHGQFLPSGIQGPLFVVENNSEGKSVTGLVNFIDDIALVPINVDLVMNCYVLEHMPNLETALDDMRSKLREGGFLHLEVPIDRFTTSKLHKSYLYRNYLHFLTRHRRMFVSIDFVSGAYRQVTGRIPWFGIVKQSEHINYFDSKSLRRFVDIHGGNVIYMSREDLKYKVGRIRQGRLACVAI